MQQLPGQPQKRGTDIVVQGRIVWGGVKKQIKKVYGTQTPAIDPKTGQQIDEYVFGLAVPKPSSQSNQHEVANFQTLWNAIATEGAKVGFQQPGQPGFHWKFDDGDGKKADGSSYPEHSRGCIIVACKTRLPLKLMAWDGASQKYIQITEEEIKCGDYIQVALNVSGHGNPNAGLYINPSFVARIAYGQAIVNAPDASVIFGNTPPPMPVGGSATPIGGGFAPQMPAFGAAPMQPQDPQQPAAPVQPNYGVLPGQFAPAAQQQAPQVPGGMAYGQPMAPGPTMPQAPQQQALHSWWLPGQGQ